MDKTIYLKDPLGDKFDEEIQDKSTEADADNEISLSQGHRRKETVLILCTRGTPARYRHLMLDFVQLLPHSKKESKLDIKKDFKIVADIAEIKSCTSAVLFECRKMKDLYIWMSRTPSGPSIKFASQNIHTMSELRLSGNHLKGSRPALSFDKSFDAAPHYQLTKELLTQIFATPQRHHKSKPFFDHVISFSIADNRIWIRNYQVVPEYVKTKIKTEATTLIEVGPRVTLQIIRIFEGPFGGPTLYHNPEFISPNAIRSAMRKKKSNAKSLKNRRKSGHKKTVKL